MLNVNVKISGDKETQARLKRLGRSLHDMRNAMDIIGQTAKEYYANEAYASQGGVFGAKWLRLKAAYAMRKAKIYPGKGILLATGAMRESFVYLATNEQATVTNVAPYFKYHQSTLPRRRLPRRQMIGINGRIRQMVADTIKQDIERKIRKA